MNSDRPWMTALEMQFAALRNARRPRCIPDAIGDRLDDIGLQLLPSSVPFAWSKDVGRAVWLASRTVPEDSVLCRDVLPEGVRTAWWWFDDPLPIPMEPIEAADTNVISGLLLHADYESGVLLVIDARMTILGPAFAGFSAFPFDRTLGALVREKRISPINHSTKEPSAHGLPVLRFILAAHVWLRQRIISLTSGPVERHRRKQIAREYHVPPPTDVKVIQLRRLESGSRGDSGQHESIEWSCRWIVNGHWRNQVYANNERKLIYIMPFVKGPADMPLRVPTHTVYQVNR